jgi:UDP-N-acetylglucosamine/UDP-N-acetylgalactosamine diphosphorylase
VKPLRSSRTPPIAELRERFAEYRQDHVFRFWEGLDAAARERLARQAARIDLDLLARVHAAATRGEGPPPRLAPAATDRHPSHGGDAAAWDRARERGEALLRDGRVAIVLVAGGQGTRLGFDGPKGAYPLGPVSGRTLFELQAQKLRALERRYGRRPPWFVMTSPATDAPTRAFFREHGRFGLPEADVAFFEQATVPALDFAGRLVLEAPDRIFESPNGHGGSLTALLDSGSLDGMEDRGITTLFYYQVDNPLVRMADPVYLGFHAGLRAEMSCKVVAKSHPGERMGVVARLGARLGIVEYTELDEEHANARDEHGELVYWQGSIGIHALETAFVRRVAQKADDLLPFHVAAKKIPHVDAGGRRVEPDEPNGYKLERFVFDALPAAERVAVVEGLREEEFAPVKNADGEDSPATARAALTALYRRWLEAAGVEPPPAGARIEIDHARFDGAEDLRRAGIRSLAQAADAIRIAPGGTR